MPFKQYTSIYSPFFQILFPAPFFLSFFQVISYLTPSQVNIPNPSFLSPTKLPQQIVVGVISLPYPFFLSYFQEPAYRQPEDLFQQMPQPFLALILHYPQQLKPFLYLLMPNIVLIPFQQKPVYSEPSSSTFFQKVSGYLPSANLSRYANVCGNIFSIPTSAQSTATSTSLKAFFCSYICQIIQFSFLRKCILSKCISVPFSALPKQSASISLFLIISASLSISFILFENISCLISLLKKYLNVSLIFFNSKQRSSSPLIFSQKSFFTLSLMQKVSIFLSSESRILSMLLMILMAIPCDKRIDTWKVTLTSWIILLTYESCLLTNSQILRNFSSKGQYRNFYISPALISSTASNYSLCFSWVLKKQVSQTSRVGKSHLGLMQTQRMSLPSWPSMRHLGAIDHLTLWISFDSFLGECGFSGSVSFGYLPNFGRETDFWLMVLFYSSAIINIIEFDVKESCSIIIKTHYIIFQVV